jgi:hypothetical protein
VETHQVCRRSFAMPLDLIEAMQCKFCSGKLLFDFERKEKAPGFSYYRCENCELSNIFAVTTGEAGASRIWPYPSPPQT